MRSLGRPKPRWFLVAATVGSEHEEAELRRPVQVKSSGPFGRHRAEIPAWGMHADDFASRLKGSWLVGITFFVWSAAEAQKTAVRRPVHMVDIVRLILDAQTPLTHCR